MKKLSMIMGLRRSLDAFNKELTEARDAPYPEYYRFLRALGFGDYIDQVITACVMYPRSVEICQDTLRDLAYGMYSELGIGRFRLNNRDQERLTSMVHNTGVEVIAILDSHCFYFQPHQLPKGASDDPEYLVELTAVPTVVRISDFTFRVDINEFHEDDDISELSHKTSDTSVSRKWIH
jgi:hypothetical protein